MPKVCTELISKYFNFQNVASLQKCGIDLDYNICFCHVDLLRHRVLIPNILGFGGQMSHHILTCMVNDRHNNDKLQLILEFGCSIKPACYTIALTCFCCV